MRIIATLCIIALVAAAPSNRRDATPHFLGGERPPSDGVVITLLHTNDLHGSVHYPGEARGIAKIATLARRVRRAMPHVFLVDGGDIIHGTPTEKMFEGRSVIAAMNAAGYDAAVAGNHEFDFGQRIARAAIAAARFPMLSANVEAASGEPWGGLRPFILRDADGIRIAFFGLTTHRTPEIQWPRTIDGIAFMDPIDAARTLVPKLREVEGADVVVALTHLGVAADRELAAAVPGIDVILGGHSHTRLDEHVWVGETLIIQSGSAARNLARVDLHVRSDGGSRIVVINGEGGQWWGRDGVAAPLGRNYPDRPLIPLTASLPDDSAVAEAYRPFATEVEAYLDEQLTTALEPLPAQGPARGEIALGHLQADAVRAHTGADIGLSALYSLNPAGLPAGAVRVRDVYELFGGYTRQHLVVVRAPGSLIREVLETANDTAITLHVSGVRESAGALHIGGSPIDAARVYTVASAAHIIQDHMLGNEGVTVVSDDPEAATIRDATIDYLRDHGPLRNSIEPRLWVDKPPQRRRRTAPNRPRTAISPAGPALVDDDSMPAARSPLRACEQASHCLSWAHRRLPDPAGTVTSDRPLLRTSGVHPAGSDSRFRSSAPPHRCSR